MKLYKDIHLMLATIAVGLLFGNCSNDQVGDFFRKIIQVPPSSIERNMKEHEQTYAVHAILRMGYKGGMISIRPDRSNSIQAYNTYRFVNSSTSTPIMQEIDTARDDDGQMTIVVEHDCFDVIVPDDIYYGSELEYYDQNNMFISHQFSGHPFMKDKDGYNVLDKDNAILLIHQRFFGIGSAFLNKVVADSSSTRHGQEVRGLQMAYPRSLASLPIYYDRYTFKEKGGAMEAATKFSTSSVYIPDDYTLGQDLVPFGSELTWRSIGALGEPGALQLYNSDRKIYHFHKTIDPVEPNRITPGAFIYEYRDTDPVGEELEKLFTEAYNDDFTDPDTEAPRQRYGHTVGLLYQKRSLDVGSDLNRLGFRGIVRFHRLNITFQLQMRIYHILNKGQQHAGESEKPAKYCNTNNSERSFLRDFNQL